MGLRQIVLDTETTGLSPKEGHRVIEIGAVEMVNRRLTGNNYHHYINPEREIDEGALKVHGISNAFLMDKPLFEELISDFVQYIDGAELIIHNAPFDVGFLNHEFHLIGKPYRPLEAYCGVLDTLVMARQKHPGQRNSLDALCKRYDVNNQDRVLHGALLDAKILAQVYLAMTGGQVNLFGEEEKSDSESNDAETSASGSVMRKKTLPIIEPSSVEADAHRQFVELLNKASDGECLF